MTQLRLFLVSSKHRSRFIFRPYLILLFVFLFPIIVTSPSNVITDDHAYASEAGYDYWAAHGFQWGVDVLQNIGPLGPMHFPLTYTGILDYENMVGNFIISAFLDFAFIFLFAQFSSNSLKFGFLASFLSLQLLKEGTSFPFTPEVNHYLLMIFVTYVIYIYDRYFILIPIAMLLAAMSLGKGIFLTLSIFIMFFYSIRLLMVEKMAKLLVFTAAFCFTLVLSWKISGQDLSNILVFLRGSYAFSSGYTEALNGKPVEPNTWPHENFYIGLELMVAILSAVLVIRKLFVRSNDRAAIGLISITPLAITELFFIFVVWKYGVVAADKYHLLVGILFLGVCLIPFSVVSPDHHVSGLGMKWEGGESLVFNKSCSIPFFLIALFSPAYLAGLKLILQPGKVFLESNVKLEQSIFKLQMPKIRGIVGYASVGYFGERIAPMIYNNFSYRPTPSTISFVAWNDFLINLDAEFIRDNNRAPEYLIYDAYNFPSSITQQFWPMDSVKMQLEILRYYSPVLDELNQPIQELGRLLLRRRDPSAKLDFHPIDRRNARLTEQIKVPEDFVDPVQMVVDLHHKPLAMLVGLLYKYPIYRIRFTLDDGTIEERLFTPNKARNGFMISPIILNNRDYISVMSEPQWRAFVAHKESTVRRIVSFEIRCSYLSSLCTKDFDILFNKISGLGLGHSKIP